MASLQPHLLTFEIFPTKKHNRPAPPPYVRLSALDPLDSPIQIINHRYFRLSELTPEKFDAHVHRLRASLSEALELYPPAAGTVHLQDGDLVISGYDSGTPFIVEVKDVPFTEDTEAVTPRTETFLPLDSSVLAVKVTKFSCGTVAVASSINHQVTDLRGFVEFLQLWAQLTRGEPVDYSKIPSDWTHNPAQYFPTPVTDNPQPPPGFMVAPPTEDSDPVPYSMQPAAVTRWTVPKSALEKLKIDYSPLATDADTWISSGDALAALIWGVLTRARESVGIRVQRPGGAGRPQDPPTETLIAAVDGRDRAPNGTMSNGKYFGNFNPLYATTVPRADLLSLTDDAASRVALQIRNALKSQLTPTFLAEKIEFLEKARNSQPPQRVVFDADVIFTNWCRFDLQGPNMDFGEGRPFLATAGCNSVFPPGYSLWTQDTKSGDVTVLLTIEEGAAEEMKKDVLLNKYATLVAQVR